MLLYVLWDFHWMKGLWKIKNTDRTTNIDKFNGFNKRKAHHQNLSWDSILAPSMGKVNVEMLCLLETDAANGELCLVLIAFIWVYGI